MSNKNIKKLIKISNKINNIFNSDISWEEKYDMIFSDKISVKVFKIINLDYYDPDTTYQEDVTAFVNAFNSRMFEIQKHLI